ncbi:MAG TPA: hypothetical protein VGF18_06105 [Candidatus Tumulicola sp.]|jgi:hypothetical protein
MTSRIAAIVAVALLAGCAGGPAAGPSVSVAPANGDAMPTVMSTIPGQYKGSATDSTFGKGKATADLSKAGMAVGGDFAFNYSPDPVTGSVGLDVKQNALSGVFTSTIGSTACSFTVAAMYDPTKYTLDGTYTAKHGCTGESGSFKFKEECYYVDGLRVNDRERARPNIGGLRPC